MAGSHTTWLPESKQEARWYGGAIEPAGEKKRLLPRTLGSQLCEQSMNFYSGHRAFDTATPWHGCIAPPERLVAQAARCLSCLWGEGNLAWTGTCKGQCGVVRG